MIVSIIQLNQITECRVALPCVAKTRCALVSTTPLPWCKTERLQETKRKWSVHFWARKSGSVCWRFISSATDQQVEIAVQIILSRRDITTWNRFVPSKKQFNPDEYDPHSGVEVYWRSSGLSWNCQSIMKFQCVLVVLLLVICVYEVKGRRGRGRGRTKSRVIKNIEHPLWFNLCKWRSVELVFIMSAAHFKREMSDRDAMTTVCIFKITRLNVVECATFCISTKHFLKSPALNNTIIITDFIWWPSRQ